MGELRKIRTNLNRENKLLLNKLSSYIYINGVNTKVLNEVKLDLAGMLLECQERGDDAQSVIGNNYKEFCDELIANCPRKKLVDMIIEPLFVFGISLLMVIPLIYLLGRFLPTMDASISGFIFYCEPYYLSILLTGELTGIIATFFLQQLSFSKNQKLLYIISFMIIFIIINSLVLYVVKHFAENNLVKVNLLVAGIITLLLFTVLYVIREWRMRNQLKVFANSGEAR
jgi:DNA-binding ferritin-like protein (Dps family)